MVASLRAGDRLRAGSPGYASRDRVTGGLAPCEGPDVTEHRAKPDIGDRVLHVRHEALERGQLGVRDVLQREAHALFALGERGHPVPQLVPGAGKAGVRRTTGIDSTSSSPEARVPLAQDHLDCSLPGADADGGPPRRPAARDRSRCRWRSPGLRRASRSRSGPARRYRSHRGRRWRRSAPRAAAERGRASLPRWPERRPLRWRLGTSGRPWDGPRGRSGRARDRCGRRPPRPRGRSSPNRQ